MPTINIVRPGTPGAFNTYGGCKEFLECRDRQIFLYGGTGSGKTTAACYKMLMLCLKYPGVKFLFTRKSYRALVKSGVETFERVIRQCGLEIGKGSNKIRKLGETEPKEFTFPYSKQTWGGRIYEGTSRVLIASLANAYDEMGSEYDYIYVNQPEEILEQDWQFLVTRATGRRGVAPYPQMFGDPNPQHERHWIKTGGYEIVDGEQVGDDTRWRLIKSTYKDNPIIWDHEKQELTVSGQEQMGILNQSLDSVNRKRLIDGEWASYEGLVYGDSFNYGKHVKTRKEFDQTYQIDDSWPRFWGIDFGFRDPFVCSIFAKHPEKELYVRHKLIFYSNRTVEENANTIRDILQVEPRPVLIVADRNPQEIQVLQNELGLNIATAKKGAGSVKAGISIISEMLRQNELVFLSDALVEEDQELIDAKIPIGFPEEADNYRWDLAKKTTNEQPIGKNDHELDAVRYLFTHIKADKRVVKAVWL